VSYLHGFFGGWGKGKEKVINYFSDFDSFLFSLWHFRSFFFLSFFFFLRFTTGIHKRAFLPSFMAPRYEGVPQFCDSTAIMLVHSGVKSFN